METPKEPWGFCETPEEKCTMNYCDDNGCQNRKRALVSEPQKLETLYRKVTFEIDEQDHNRTVLVGKNANFIFNPNTKNGEELTDFLSGCEEIPDPTAQLEADKAELLEALETILYNSDVPNEIYDQTKSLIQKMKQ